MASWQGRACPQVGRAERGFFNVAFTTVFLVTVSRGVGNGIFISAFRAGNSLSAIGGSGVRRRTRTSMGMMPLPLSASSRLCFPDGYRDTPIRLYDSDAGDRCAVSHAERMVSRAIGYPTARLDWPSPASVGLPAVNMRSVHLWYRSIIKAAGRVVQGYTSCAPQGGTRMTHGRRMPATVRRRWREAPVARFPQLGRAF